MVKPNATALDKLAICSETGCTTRATSRVGTPVPKHRPASSAKFSYEIQQRCEAAGVPMQASLSTMNAKLERVLHSQASRRPSTARHAQPAARAPSSICRCELQSVQFPYSDLDFVSHRRAFTAPATGAWQCSEIGQPSCVVGNRPAWRRLPPRHTQMKTLRMRTPGELGMSCLHRQARPCKGHLSRAYRAGRTTIWDQQASNTVVGENSPSQGGMKPSLVRATDGQGPHSEQTEFLTAADGPVCHVEQPAMVLNLENLLESSPSVLALELLRMDADELKEFEAELDSSNQAQTLVSQAHSAYIRRQMQVAGLQPQIMCQQGRPACQTCAK